MFLYLFLFLEFLYPSFNNLLGLPYSSTVFRFLTIILLISILVEFGNYVIIYKKLPKKYFIVLCVGILVFAAVCLTIFFYNVYQPHAWTNYLIFLIRSIPTLLTIPLFLTKDIAWHLKRIQIIFLFVGMSLLIFSITNISNSFIYAMINYGGVNYNDYTFISAVNILFGLILFEKFEGIKTRKYMPFLNMFFLIVSTITLFLGAGRSGILAGLILYILYFYKNILKVSGNIKNNIFSWITFLIIVGIIVFSLNSNDLLSSGLERSISFINFGSNGPLINWSNTSGRLPIYHESLKIFYSSPLWGNGIGSIYLLHPIAYFSHNLILDILAEGGLLLFLIFIIILLKIIINYKQTSYNFYSRISLFILVLIIIKLFTGSNYLIEPLFFFSITMLLVIDRNPEF